MKSSIQEHIEALYAAGRCPRLHVNARLEGVVCPDFIRNQWQERLIIDLDKYGGELDLKYAADGLSATLSFDGYATRCTFPYDSISMVGDRCSRWPDRATAPSSKPAPQQHPTFTIIQGGFT